MNFYVLVGFVAFAAFHIAVATSEADKQPAPAADASTSGADNETDASSKKFKEYADLSPEQRSGVVTVELKDVSNDKDARELHKKFPGVVVTILNQAEKIPIPPITEKRRRRRRRDTGHYTEDGILLVEVQPAVLDGRLRISLAAQDKTGRVLKARSLEQELKNDTDVIDSQMGKPVHTIYRGLPDDFEEALAAIDRRPTVWEEHWKMFLVVLILIAVAIVIVIICFLCFYCCSRRQRFSPTKVELTSKPGSVREDMMEVTPIVPLQYAPVSHQSPTKNDPAPVDEENGWIVPIDQLSPEELEQSDIQISKL